MFFKSKYRKLISRRWTIGFVQNNIHGILCGEPLCVRWLKHNCKDRWFADPFILDVTEKEIIVLVEEYYNPIRRGRIARLTINRQSMELIKTEPVLTLDTHLSFPVIVRCEGKIFIYPESGESGALTMYEYDVKKNTVKAVEQLCDEFLADAVITNLFGDELMFCTLPPDYNKDTLYIYRRNADGLFKKIESVKFQGDCIARMAGEFFVVDGRIYRPAQDCNNGYGNGTVIQEVKHENGAWEFKEVRRYFSPNLKYELGIHTLNMYKDWIVVDAVGYWNPIVGRCISKLRRG